MTTSKQLVGLIVARGLGTEGLGLRLVAQVKPFFRFFEGHSSGNAWPCDPKPHTVCGCRSRTKRSARRGDLTGRLPGFHPRPRVAPLLRMPFPLCDGSRRGFSPQEYFKT